MSVSQRTQIPNRLVNTIRCILRVSEPTRSPSLANAGSSVGEAPCCRSIPSRTSTNVDSPSANSFCRLMTREFKLSIRSYLSTFGTCPSWRMHVAKIFASRCLWDKHSLHLITACWMLLASSNAVMVSSFAECSRPWATSVGGAGRYCYIVLVYRCAAQEDAYVVVDGQLLTLILTTWNLFANYLQNIERQHSYHGGFGASAAFCRRCVVDNT